MLKNTLKKNKERNNIIHDENQYLNLIDDILNEGVMVNGRNGKAKTIFGSAMHFDLTNGILPILTTKRTAWKTCLKELLWFISGSTNNDILQKNNVKIWNGNSSREFLDSRGLYNLRENDLGPIYGHQWRFFNAKYNNCDVDRSGGPDVLLRGGTLMPGRAARDVSRLTQMFFDFKSIGGPLFIAKENLFR